MKHLQVSIVVCYCWTSDRLLHLKESHWSFPVSAIGCHACKTLGHFEHLQQYSLALHPVKLPSPKWAPSRGECRTIVLEQKHRATPLLPPTKTCLHFICFCRSHPKEASQLRGRWEIECIITLMFFLWFSGPFLLSGKVCIIYVDQ